MEREDPRLRAYRRTLIVLVLCGAVVAVGAAVWLVIRGRYFNGFMALLAAGLFVLLAHGYRQDAEERRRGG